MDGKVCTKCNIWKPFNEFTRLSNSKDGYKSRCRKCRNEDYKKYREKHREKFLDTRRKYVEENKDAINKKKKEIYHRNKEKYRARSRAYNARNPGRTTRYARERNKIDPLFKFRRLIRRRVSHSFKKISLNKNTNTEKILGASIGFIKDYFESQFKKGMTWNNMGSVWEIDHIVPISTAKTEKDVVKLNHYTNLRPAFKEENRSKSNKFPSGYQLRLL